MNKLRIKWNFSKFFLYYKMTRLNFSHFFITQLMDFVFVFITKNMFFSSLHNIIITRVGSTFKNERVSTLISCVCDYNFPWISLKLCIFVWQLCPYPSPPDLDDDYKNCILQKTQNMLVLVPKTMINWYTIYTNSNRGSAETQLSHVLISYHKKIAPLIKLLI